MANKRSCEVVEFDDVSSVVQPSANAKIHGVVTTVSPMKKGKSCGFFDAEICDDKGSMRVFGFDSSVRRRLLEYQSDEEAYHCHIVK